MSHPPLQSEQQWLEQARAWILRGDFAQAEPVLNAALSELPRSFELRRLLAAVYRQTHREREAEALLRSLLSERPQDAGAAFTLAQLLIEQVRTQAAAKALREFFDGGSGDAELAIRAIELLDESDRKADAAAIAESAIVMTPDDPRLHAYAGMLQLQLGEFDCARQHYIFALEHEPQACEWRVPHGLAHAQRYCDADHLDFARFRACLRRESLSDNARSTLLFALGKAHDDIGEYAQAASYFREANAIAHRLTRWSRKDWRRGVESRLAAPPIMEQLRSDEGFIPIFIIGMPRSGTTLTAELLGRYPRVHNRGELPWIARLAQQPELAFNPPHTALVRARDIYASHARQDDANEARWFIDKQPLNFRYIDLILALYPDAKVIHCTRSPRDTALSLWTQSFLEDVQGYSYDFADIRAVQRDEVRLTAHWRRQFPRSIRSVCYEELIASPGEMIAATAKWIGLDEMQSPSGNRPSSSISTASLWQARQPVYASSVERWRAYVEYLPELNQFPIDPTRRH